MEKIVARPSISGGGNSPSVSLHVERQQWSDKGKLDHTDETIANYTLRFLPDTNEVIVLRDDEAVYSELLS